MALSNELSSEIAAALLSTSNKSPHELKDLQEVVFRIHSVLSQMEEQNSRKVGAGGEQNTSAAAAAGN